VGNGENFREPAIGVDGEQGWAHLRGEGAFARSGKSRQRPQSRRILGLDHFGESHVGCSAIVLENDQNCEDSSARRKPVMFKKRYVKFF
jgi:hypothetical protein